MSEKNFQKALFHLYVNIERYNSYSETIFEQFEVSSSEQQALKELMTSQRDGLLLFNQQLRDKQRRFIRHVLPKSREILSHQLETLLDGYLSGSAPEGARDPADALRSFATYVVAQIDARKDTSRELELIRFETICSSVSLPVVSPVVNERNPPQMSPELRLSLAGNVALDKYTYDVCATMEDPSLLEISKRPLKPCWFFLFRDRSNEVRVMSVAPGLANVLAMFLSGLSLGEVLDALPEGEAKKTAASDSIEKLVSLGAPFYSQCAVPIVHASNEVVVRPEFK